MGTAGAAVWQDAVGRRTVKADTTTTYTPIVADENLMVTLSNAAAITVTLPQNSAQAFPVGAEVDFLWFGVGQPTFAAGTGATVNGTPGLKLRARYSAATAKKIATNDVGRHRGLGRMTSVGIMASSVVSRHQRRRADGTVQQHDRMDVRGRVVGHRHRPHRHRRPGHRRLRTAYYNLAAGVQSDTLTVGFAVNTPTRPATGNSSSSCPTPGRRPTT